MSSTREAQSVAKGSNLLNSEPTDEMFEFIPSLVIRAMTALALHAPQLRTWACGGKESGWEYIC